MAKPKQAAPKRAQKSTSKRAIKVRTKAPPKPPKTDVDGLNLKQRLFVNEYLKDLNAKQAAIRAGYSERSAEVTGSRLLSHAKVSEAIGRATEKRVEKTKIDQEWLLKRLDDEANADINDLYDSEGNFKPVNEWPLIWRTGLVESIKMGDVTIDGKAQRRPVEIKVSGRIKRVELIGKHVAVQAFRERAVHELPPGVAEAIIDASMTAKQAAEKYREKLG